MALEISLTEVAMFGITGRLHACTCMKHVLYLYRRYKMVQTCTKIDTDDRTQLSLHTLQVTRRRDCHQPAASNSPPHSEHRYRSCGPCWLSASIKSVSSPWSVQYQQNPPKEYSSASFHRFLYLRYPPPRKTSIGIASSSSIITKHIFSFSHLSQNHAIFHQNIPSSISIKTPIAISAPDVFHHFLWATEIRDPDFKCQEALCIPIGWQPGQGGGGGTARKFALEDPQWRSGGDQLKLGWQGMATSPSIN